MDNAVSFFRSGWRPFAGWVCVSGLLVQIVFIPLVVGLCSLFGHQVVFPTLDMSSLLTMLGSMLGLGTLRTAEKLNGVP